MEYTNILMKRWCINFFKSFQIQIIHQPYSGINILGFFRVTARKCCIKSHRQKVLYQESPPESVLLIFPYCFRIWRQVKSWKSKSWSTDWNRNEFWYLNICLIFVFAFACLLNWSLHGKQILSDARPLYNSQNKYYLWFGGQYKHGFLTDRRGFKTDANLTNRRNVSTFYMSKYCSNSWK